jgi:predicted transcriptional regulator
MDKAGVARDRNLEKTVREILKSRARSRIYVYLLRKNGARSEQIIKGTRLHPSTVRETLSKMYYQGFIYRKKLKNDNIGKNPFIYFSISPVELLKKNVNDLENRLNKLANLAFPKKQSKNFKPVRIKIIDKVEDA